MTDDKHSPAPRRRPRRVGEHGLLVDVADIARVHALTGWIRTRPWSRELAELVPGGTTIYLEGPDSVLARAAEELLGADGADDGRQAAPRHHVLPVRYDGPDLDEVARAAGTSREAVVRLHSAATYTVDFFGFAPGMAYLGGVPEEVRRPRREVPRTRVPANSLAMANEHTIVYPRAPPGGWNLIGTYLGDPLFHPDADRPTTLDIGDTITFEDVDA